jgi:hypothetical protein
LERFSRQKERLQPSTVGYFNVSILAQRKLLALE